MRFMLTDGGRSISKRPKQTMDCAVVATATLLRLPYDVVFDELKRLGRKNNDGFHFPHGRPDGPPYGKLLGHWFEYEIMLETVTLGKNAWALADGLADVEIFEARHVCAIRRGVVWDFHDKKVLEKARLFGHWTCHKI